MRLRDLRVLDSITQVAAGDHTVVLAASHGGIYAGYLAAKLGVAGVILHDAGGGLDDAGRGSLPWLAELGIGAATVGYESARIGDGFDCVRRGAISDVNAVAETVGCRTGQPALACAERMHDLPGPTAAVPERGHDGRVLDDGEPPVWGLDSLSLVEERHAGTIVITGSHGERLAGERESYLPTAVAGASFFDAGIGADDAGIGRLPHLNGRRIPAVTVSVDSARIGDAESAWADGRISRRNELASELGIERGDPLPAFAAAIRADP